jgi:hypothetical protein
VNNVRSFVWITPNIAGRPPATFAENWRSEMSVLQYDSQPRFEIAHSPEHLDPIGHNFWHASGVIVSLGQSLFIRAADPDNFRDHHRLVNISDGSVYEKEPPREMWTFLSWNLVVRDPDRQSETILAQFSARQLDG